MSVLKDSVEQCLNLIMVWIKQYLNQLQKAIEQFPVPIRKGTGNAIDNLRSLLDSFQIIFYKEIFVEQEIQLQDL